MTQVTLNIPDNEFNFFMKLIEKFNYTTEINQFELSQDMKDVLDERRATSSAVDFIPWENVKNQIHFKKE
ncbi:hypothetical protein OX283_013625 [Flavobacterium sp. SUN052]|uniref:hypothetical protein n=1 Tax=Flavobacterium sp. SUN052 TaxID=3002441 RepID=UPI00237D82D5|nr:hypothetical protein [Flavobacterium sp. SUN052]MEC4005705.1 hypothetical protein [Flavobacterium sp. SUN052]